MDAGHQTMLGHEVEISGGIGDGVFAAEIARAIHLVIDLGDTDLHGVERHVINAGLHVGARRGYGKHAADAADQFAGLRVPGGVYRAADQTRVIAGTITHIGFHSRIPVPLAHHLSGDA